MLFDEANRPQDDHSPSPLEEGQDIPLPTTMSDAGRKGGAALKGRGRAGPL